MKTRVIIRIISLLLGIVALAMIPSLILALIDGDEQCARAFTYPIVIALTCAIIAIFLGRNTIIRFNPGDGFFLVSMAWFLTGIAGAVPLYLSGSVHSMADAIFESISGITTTGATIFNDVEGLSRAILFWRAMTHWLGGMGIVVLTVAILPLLGVGAFQLIKAETPGPEKDKVVPRINEAAKILWLLYIGLTTLQTILLMFGGMTLFDAITHSFATMATGGFGTRNESIGYYNSAYIDWVCTVFMIMAGFNFTLYYRIIKGKFRDLVTNTEARVYLSIFIFASLIISLSILSRYGSFAKAMRYGAFQAATVLTTTGFATADFDAWPQVARGVLFLLMFVGGCSGSTGGGIKVIRHVVLFKQTGNEMRRLLYPRGVFSVRLNKKAGRKDVVYGVAGFVYLYLILVMAVTLVVAFSGTDLFSSLSTALVTIGNIGPGFGAVGPTCNYAFFPGYVKLVLSFAMIAGRLELWTVLILLKREFWHR